jgi:hypothetical protein
LATQRGKYQWSGPVVAEVAKTFRSPVHASEPGHTQGSDVQRIGGGPASSKPGKGSASGPNTVELPSLAPSHPTAPQPKALHPIQLAKIESAYRELLTARSDERAANEHAKAEHANAGKLPTTENLKAIDKADKALADAQNRVSVADLNLGNTVGDEMSRVAPYLYSGTSSADIPARVRAGARVIAAVEADEKKKVAAGKEEPQAAAQKVQEIRKETSMEVSVIVTNALEDLRIAPRKTIDKIVGDAANWVVNGDVGDPGKDPHSQFVRLQTVLKEAKAASPASRAAVVAQCHTHGLIISTEKPGDVQTLKDLIGTLNREANAVIDAYELASHPTP